MGQAPTASFRPTQHGFPFASSWPVAPAITVSTPFGSFGLADTARAMCGGMVFAALDYWLDHTAPPATRPAPGSPAYEFIVRRLIDSWNLPAGLAQYYQWMNLPDHDGKMTVLGLTVATPHGLPWRTIEQQWPRVRATIDGGQPATLGLVTAASPNPAMIIRNYQVLAYDYEVSGPDATLRVYDPGLGPDDNARIRFRATRPDAGIVFGHNLSIRQPIRGFFQTSYSPAVPPMS